MKHLTDEEILDIATRHCEFTPEGSYHLRRYSGKWAIVQVVRDCFELAELCRQAEAPTACIHGYEHHDWRAEGRGFVCKRCAATNGVPGTSKPLSDVECWERGLPDSIDRAMAFEQQARDAYEREFQADSRDPSQAQGFDLFLRGYIACGVETCDGGGHG